MPSRIDARNAGLEDGTPSSHLTSQSKRDTVIERLKRHADFSIAYKEANVEKGDVARKRLKLDEDFAAKEIEIMEKNASSREKEATARTSEVQGHHLEKLYRDLKDDLKEAKEEMDEHEIQKIKKRLRDVQNKRHAMIINNE